MKQKAQDFLMLIQQDRRAKFFAILAVLAILFVMFGARKHSSTIWASTTYPAGRTLGKPGFG